MSEILFLFEHAYFRPVDGLRNYVGVSGGPGEEVSHRNTDQNLRRSLCPAWDADQTAKQDECQKSGMSRRSRPDH